MTTKHSSQYERWPHPTDRARTARPRPLRAPQENEARLIQQIAAQDHCAFEALYHSYRPRLMAFLTHYLGSAALCEEVVHEVLLIVWEQAAHFRVTTRVSTWIFGIAHHKALQARAAVAKTASAATQAPPVWRPENLPEIHVLQQAQTQEVAKALTRLPPEQRTALILVYHQDCSYPEVAARTGYPVSMVRSQVRQARHRLAALLARE